MKTFLTMIITAITFTAPILAQTQNTEPVEPQAQNIVIAVPLIGDVLIRDCSPALVDQLDAFSPQDYIQNAELNIAQLDTKKAKVNTLHHEPKKRLLRKTNP